MASLRHRCLSSNLGNTEFRFNTTLCDSLFACCVNYSIQVKRKKDYHSLLMKAFYYLFVLPLYFVSSFSTIIVRVYDVIIIVK